MQRLTEEDALQAAKETAKRVNFVITRLEDFNTYVGQFLLSSRLLNNTQQDLRNLQPHKFDALLALLTAEQQDAVRKLRHEVKFTDCSLESATRRVIDIADGLPGESKCSPQ